MSNLLQKEVEKGRILGPFRSPPFPNLSINAIGFVPKKLPNEFRMIVDLSQPEELSVNAHIPRVESQVSFPSVQSAIDIIMSLVEMAGAPMLSKLDIKSAFRLLPLAPSEFPLLGMRFDGNIYKDAFLPMGASSRCRIFQEFSNAFSHVLTARGGIQNVIAYLDDYLIISESMPTAKSDMEAFIRLANQINLSLAHDKTAGQSPVLVFLGIEVDCTALEARLPVDKVMKAEKLIQRVLQSNKIWHKQIESLHGYLNYCAKIIPAGRAFLRSLSRLLHVQTKWVRLPHQIKLDHEVWLSFVRQFNGKAMFINSRGFGQIHMTLETDSSSSWGCAAILYKEYITMQWPMSVPRNNLALLEFYPILVSVFIWSEKLHNKQ